MKASSLRLFRFVTRWKLGGGETWNWRRQEKRKKKKGKEKEKEKREKRGERKTSAGADRLKRSVRNLFFTIHFTTNMIVNA